ncbi:MAG: hypothetical protein PHR56_08800 [Dehalococcoidales bacterium]|nr:hypothetical protein [Dehalococcoidales bacterium]
MHLWQSVLIMTVMLFLVMALTGCSFGPRENSRQQRNEYYRAQYEAALRDFQRQQDEYNKSLEAYYRALADNLTQYYRQQHENDQKLLQQQIQQAQQQQ